jgi:hypothetical protein
LSHLWAIRLAIINYNSIKHSSLFHSNEYMILLMNILIDLLTKIRLNIFSFALNFPVLIILVLIVPCAHRSVLIVPRAHRSVLIVPCSSFHVLIVPVPPSVTVTWDCQYLTIALLFIYENLKIVFTKMMSAESSAKPGRRKYFLGTLYFSSWLPVEGLNYVTKIWNFPWFYIPFSSYS